MPAINTPARTRPLCDISSWGEVNLSTLRSREKKRFNKRKAAVIAYLTTATPLEQIMETYNFSPERIHAMSQKCLLIHEDGSPWGYRALLPGAHVIDHPPLPSRPAPVPTEQQDDSTERGEQQNQPEEANEPCNELDEQTEERPAVLILVKEAPAEPEILVLEVVEAAPGEIPETRCPAVLSEDVEEPVKQATEVALVDVSEVPVLATPDASDTSALVLSKYVKRKKRMRDTALGQQRHVIHKHWAREAQSQKQKQRLYRWVSLAVVAVILLATLLPLGTGIAAYSIYTTLRAQALDGVNHLLNVKAILPISKSDPMAALDPTRLHQAQSEFRLAEADFLQLQQLANRPDIQSIVNQVSPNYGNTLLVARHLLQ